MPGVRPFRIDTFEHDSTSSWDSSSNAAIVATPVFSGTKAARLQVSAGKGEIFMNSVQVGDPHMWARVRFSVLPDADIPILSASSHSGSPQYRKGIAFDAATGKVKPYIQRAFPASGMEYGTPVGPVLVVDTWYVLEFRLDHNDTTQSYEFELVVNDDTFTEDLSTGVSSLAATRGIILGGSWSQAPAATYTMFVDSVVSNVQADDGDFFPYGTGGSTNTLFVTGDGTHVGDTNFDDDQSNSPPSGVFSRVDEFPPSTTDWVRQITDSGTSYLEMTVDTPATGDTPISLHLLSYHGPDAQTSPTNFGRWVMKVFDPETSTIDTVYQYGTHTVDHWSNGAVDLRYNAASPNWDEAALGDVKIRWGYSTDSPPLPKLYSVMLMYFAHGVDPPEIILDFIPPGDTHFYDQLLRGPVESEVVSS